MSLKSFSGRIKIDVNLIFGAQSNEYKTLTGKIYKFYNIFTILFN
jgi:hypothetical protein